MTGLKNTTPADYLADSAGILRAHGHFKLADQLMRHPELEALTPKSNHAQSPDALKLTTVGTGDQIVNDDNVKTNEYPVTSLFVMFLLVLAALGGLLYFAVVPILTASGVLR